MEPNLTEALQLVERLERTIGSAKAVPLTPQVRVDREELLSILDQLRAALGFSPGERSARGFDWRL